MISVRRSPQLLAYVLLLFVAACNGTAAPLSPPTTITGEAPIWDSLEHLTADAEMIVVGTVGAFVGVWTVEETDGSIGAADVVHDLAITEVIKGDPNLTGAVVRVGYWQVDKENVSPLNPGEHVVLYLDRFDWGGKHDGWVPLGSDTGVFDVVGDKVLGRGVLGPTAGAETTLREVRMLAASVSNG